MLHHFEFQDRLREAKRACIARMHEAAAWIEGAEGDDRTALRQCGHRLAGTLGSFGFAAEADLARALEQACDHDDAALKEARTALAAALRSLDEA